MKRVRVLIVEEHKKWRTQLSKLLIADGDMDVLTPTSDLHHTREQLTAGEVDVLLLNAEMPYIGGKTFIETVLIESPLPIVVLAHSNEQALTMAARALTDGACDGVVLPETLETSEAANLLIAELREKILAASHATIPLVDQRKNPRILHYKAKRVGLPVIAVGGSTGAVASLHRLLPPLPTITPPMVIATHVPEPLMHRVIHQLNTKTDITVVEAIDGRALQNGYAYMAPAGSLLTLLKRGSELVCHLESRNAKQANPIDALFDSVALHAGTNAIGVLLSGTGEDGAKGLAKIKKSGAFTIVQDEATSMASELPTAAIRLQQPSAILPLHEIAKSILDHSQTGKRLTPANRRGSLKA